MFSEFRIILFLFDYFLDSLSLPCTTTCEFITVFGVTAISITERLFSYFLFIVKNEKEKKRSKVYSSYHFDYKSLICIYLCVFWRY